jgi:nicotinamidase-related amidase
MSWRLDPSALGVVVIDVQEKLVPAVADGARVVKKSADLLALAQLFGLPAWVTEQVPEKLGPTVAALDLAGRGLSPIPKSAFSAAGVLPEDLPKNLLVAGIETHVCVRQTVYDLRLAGHAVYLVGDAAASRHPLDHELALAEMRRDGVVVASLEALAWELTGGAEAPLFRQALAILK